MNTYNKLMMKFWLVVTIIIPLVVTYFVITDGFKKWGVYYILAVFTLAMYLVRRFMMNRMEKHFQYLKEKEGQQN